MIMGWRAYSATEDKIAAPKNIAAKVNVMPVSIVLAVEKKSPVAIGSVADKLLHHH